MVGGKFQADADNTVRERKEKGTVSLHGRDRQVEIPPLENTTTEKPPDLLFLTTDAETCNDVEYTFNNKNPENTNTKQI